MMVFEAWWAATTLKALGEGHGEGSDEGADEEAEAEEVTTDQVIDA